MSFKRGSLGGIVSGRKLRKEALDRYYKNPNICNFCNKIIQVKETDSIPNVRLKKYCDSICCGQAQKRNSEAYKNRKKKDRFKDTEKIKSITKKNSKINLSDEEIFRLKAESGIKFLEIVTKGELFARTKNQQSARTSISAHARKVFKNSGKPYSCLICGYTNHTEVCHIREVSGFSDESFIGEINDINNLMALCPNHHWEFDNDLLEIEYPYEQDVEG